MPVIASITYVPAADFNIQRQYILGFAIGWWDGSFLVSEGNPTVAQEIVYGGYRCVVKFKDWFWEWDNRSCDLGNLFDDLYALAPGSGTPSSLGAIALRFQWVQNYSGWFVGIDLAPGLNCYYIVQRFPVQDRPYWLNIPDNLPATPFIDDCG